MRKALLLIVVLGAMLFGGRWVVGDPTVRQAVGPAVAVSPQPLGSPMQSASPDLPVATIEPASPSPSPVEVGGPDRSRVARDVASRFLLALATRPDSETDARAVLSPLAEPDLVDGLVLTDPGRLPQGTPDAAGVLEEADDATAVQVDMSSGERWLVVLGPTGRVTGMSPA